MQSSHWEKRFVWLLRLGCLSLLGLAIFFPAIFLGETPNAWLLGLGVLLVIPGVIYLMLVTIWHWKERYRGNHSGLWGALILLEASGWFKLVYLFRHIIPDARGKGRYARSEASSGQR